MTMNDYALARKRPEDKPKDADVGDIVVLMSGGQKMTVVECGLKGVMCAYFAGEELKREQFLYGALNNLSRK